MSDRSGSTRPVVHQLVPPQAGVAAAGAHEVGVGAAFDDASLVEDDDLVDLVQARQAVGDEEGRAALGEGEQVGGEGVGGRGVEVLGRLVEDEDGEVGQEGAGHADALALPAREAGTRRSDPGGQAGGQPGEPVAQADPGQHVHQLVVVGRAPAHPQVLGQGRGEEVRALLDEPDHPAHVVGGEPVERDAVEGRLAAVDRQEAHQDVGQRRLAGPARSDQRHPASRGEIEIDPAQDRLGRCPDSRPTPSAGGARAVRAPRRAAAAGRPARRRVPGRPWRRTRGRPPFASAAAPGWPPAAGPRARRRRAGRGPARPAARRRDGPPWVASHAEGQGAPAGQPGQCRGQAEPDAGRARALAGRRPQAAICQGDPLHLLGGAAHDRQLGRALDEVDHRRAQLAAGRRLLGLLAPGQAAREPGHHRGRDQEGHQQHGTGAGEEHPQDGDGARPDEARPRRRAG